MTDERFKGHDNIELMYPSIQALFRTPFRGDEAAERRFLYAYAEHFVSSTHVTETAAQIRQYSRTAEEMLSQSRECNLSGFEVMDYSDASAVIHGSGNQFGFTQSPPDPDTRTYAVVGGVSWGILRRAMNERMSYLYDIQERLHSGKAVFITEKAMVRLFANRRNGPGWQGH